MAVLKISEGQNANTNQKQFWAESLNDLQQIPANIIQSGDYGYIYDGNEKGNVYVFNSAKQWILQ